MLRAWMPEKRQEAIPSSVRDGRHSEAGAKHRPKGVLNSPTRAEGEAARHPKKNPYNNKRVVRAINRVSMIIKLLFAADTISFSFGGGISVAGCFDLLIPEFVF